MPRQIEYYFSFISPWSYLGHAEFIAVAKRHAATVLYRPVPLGRLFPETGGLPLAKRHPARQAYRLIELQRWRDKRNIPLQLHPKFWPFDPSLADRIVTVLAAQGAMLESFVALAFAAVFATDQNLADEAVLADLLTQAGFAADSLIAAGKSEAAKAAYDANLAAAMACGVFGAPSYVLEGEIFWGQDRLACLDEALAKEHQPYAANIS